jgi:hypothetical protein
MTSGKPGKPSSPIVGAFLIVLGRLLIAAGVVLYYLFIVHRNMASKRAGRGTSVFPGVIPAAALALIGLVGATSVRRGKPRPYRALGYDRRARRTFFPPTLRP